MSQDNAQAEHNMTVTTEKTLPVLSQHVSSGAGGHHARSGVKGEHSQSTVFVSGDISNTLTFISLTHSKACQPTPKTTQHTSLLQTKSNFTINRQQGIRTKIDIPFILTSHQNVRGGSGNYDINQTDKVVVAVICYYQVGKVG